MRPPTYTEKILIVIWTPKLTGNNTVCVLNGLVSIVTPMRVQGRAGGEQSGLRNLCLMQTYIIIVNAAHECQTSPID